MESFRIIDPKANWRRLAERAHRPPSARNLIADAAAPTTNPSHRSALTAAQSGRASTSSHRADARPAHRQPRSTTVP